MCYPKCCIGPVYFIEFSYGVFKLVRLGLIDHEMLFISFVPISSSPSFSISLMFSSHCCGLQSSARPSRDHQ